MWQDRSLRTSDHQTWYLIVLGTTSSSRASERKPVQRRTEVVLVQNSAMYDGASPWSNFYTSRQHLTVTLSGTRSQ